MASIDKEELKKARKAAKKKAGKLGNEFKEFIMQGNVVDLAVGVIIGGAFGKIVTSLVDDILMPLIGIVIGGLDFSQLSINVLEAKVMYGAFIQNVIDFLIVAFCIFIFVKGVNGITEKMKREKEEEEKAEEEAKKSAELEVLEEIRDLLKKK